MNSREDIVYDDLFEEVDEHNAYRYDCGGSVHIIDYDVHNINSSNNPWIRVNYWAIKGEIRTYDVGLSEYQSNVRDKKLRKLGI